MGWSQSGQRIPETKSAILPSVEANEFSAFEDVGMPLAKLLKRVEVERGRHDRPSSTVWVRVTEDAFDAKFSKVDSALAA
jgi:hypothetical protein